MKRLFFASKTIEHFLSSTQCINALELNPSKDKENEIAIKEKTKRMICTMKNLYKSSSSGNMLDIMQSLKDEYREEIENATNECALFEEEISCFEEQLSWSPNGIQSLIVIDQVSSKLNKIRRLFQCAKDLGLVDRKLLEETIQRMSKKLEDEIINTNIGHHKAVNARIYHGNQVNENETSKCDGEPSKEKGIKNISNLLLNMKSDCSVDKFQDSDKVGERKLLVDSLYQIVNTRSAEEKRNELGMETAVHILMRKLNDVAVEIIKQTWKNSSILANEMIEDERKYRLTLLRQMNTITHDIEQEYIMLRSDIENKREKVEEERRERQRLMTKNVVNEYHKLKGALEVDQIKYMQQILIEEEEQRRERLAKNSERYVNSHFQISFLLSGMTLPFHIFNTFSF